MNAFVNGIGAEVTQTTNGMEAFKGSLSANVDLFYKIGAMRGQDVIATFTKAFVENRELALRIALWARDVRGGAGERKIFRDILQYLETRDVEAAMAILPKVPEVGRWDDLLVFRYEPKITTKVVEQIRDALTAGNGLCAKWMPRKGIMAAALRNGLHWSPKQYRKTLVSLTKVVETQMCANQWEDIQFGKLPSLASARYKTAFQRHAPTAYAAYATRLEKGEEKINAGAVYPYDVLKDHFLGRVPDATTRKVIVAQWNALPNYVGDAPILPLVDVSGSMTCRAGGGNALSCLQVAVSLGLYLSDKNRGAFKDMFLTFSGSPELLHLKGDVIDKISQMNDSNWGMNTNLMAAFKLILSHAKKNDVPQEDMPKYVLILSDMQFDQCVTYGGTALDSIKKHFAEAGYEVPGVIFWNLNAHDNVPARFNDQGVALVSGFSPAIAKAIMKVDLSNMTPEYLMLQAVCVPRYDIWTNTFSNLAVNGKIADSPL